MKETWVFTNESYRGIMPFSSVWKTSRGMIGRTRISPRASYLGMIRVQIPAIVAADTRPNTTNTSVKRLISLSFAKTADTPHPL